MADPVTFIVEFDPVEHYTGHAKGYSIFTQADTMHELHDNMREAVACHFDDEEQREIWVEWWIPTAPPGGHTVELDIDRLPPLPPDSYITG